jgi:hypothetical protein
MRIGVLFIVVTVAVIDIGCGGNGGIRFSPDSLNGQAWPAELNERAYFKAAGVYARSLSGLVGHVLYPKKVNGVCPTSYSAADLSIQQYVLPGTKLEPDTTVVERYSDKIDANASVDTTVLTFVSKLAANQSSEVLVADTIAMIVPEAGMDVARLKKEVPQKLRADDCPPYFIRGAIMTTVTYRTATEVKADATVSGGAFSANGKVYNAAHRFSLDYRLGVTVLPVKWGKDIGSEVPPRALAGLEPPENGFPGR